MTIFHQQKKKKKEVYSGTNEQKLQKRLQSLGEDYRLGLLQIS